MLIEALTKKIRSQYPNLRFREETSPEQKIVFPAINPEVGDIEVVDDKDELTVYLGNFTHSHFSNYDDHLSEKQKEEIISKEVLEFLNALFNDQVVMWGSHEKSGGWFFINEKNDSETEKKFVWSGPLQNHG